MLRIRSTLAVGFAALFALSPSKSVAQADEIQVYQGGLASVGTFNLTVHNNFTPRGIRTPAFPGAVTSHQSLNGVTEFAYGVTKWFEAGLYLPLYSIDKDMGFGIDGMKLRTLFARPNGDERKFVFGVGFELSYNAKRWDSNRVTSEIRPIIGWHLNPVDIIINPIFDTEYDQLKNLVFAPSVRVALNIKNGWAAAIEEYADYGPIHRLYSGNNQSHQIYAVVDHSGKTWDIEAGIGAGLTDAADKLTLKLIVARDLYVRKK